MEIMEQSDRHTHLPNIDRVSTLIGMILLTYVIAHFINLPGRQLSIQLPGLYLGIQLGVQEIVAILVALMTASGTDWLLRSHPHLANKPLGEHWLLPGVTAWIIGLPLLQLPLSLTWWIGFVLAGTLLILVLLAEYIVVDPSDLRHQPAAAGLTAVAFSLFLILCASLKFAGPRLFLLVPAIALAVFLVSLRTLRLRFSNEWAFIEAGLVTLVTIQIAVPMNYWPLSPVAFGLALLGPAYSLTNLFGNLAEGEPPRKALIEPFVILGLIWTAAILIG
jgi:hypothetical protein